MTKQFKDLKQLDRIEYLLAKREVDFLDFQPFGTLYRLLTIIIFITAFTILLAYHNVESARTIANVIPVIWLVTKYIFIILLICQAVSFIFYLKKKRKLKEHFKLK